MDYSYHAGNWTRSSPMKIYSAYMPGPYNGISDESSLATLNPPSGFPGQGEVMRRNYYSTKLITLDSVQRRGNFDEVRTNFSIYSEGDLKGADDRKQDTFSNPLDAQSAGADISSIRY